MSDWQQLIVTVKHTDVDPITAFLEEFALAVSIGDAADEPVYQVNPGETPLWQLATITALFHLEEDLSSLIAQLKNNFPQLEKIEIQFLEEQDWVRLSQLQFPPQSFGDRLWIYPSWQEVPADIKNLVRIDPGLAFGTGTHATTALCLQWLASHEIANKTVIDYGCGSGILALAALALGAQKVTAIDHDPQALTATQNNANLNLFVDEGNLIIMPATDSSVAAVDVVIANILANPLIELATQITDLVKKSGQLILSGLLQTEKDAVYAAYKNQFNLIAVTEKDEWCCLALQKNDL